MIRLARPSAARTVATVFGVGLLKPGPGTWGTLAALPFGWLAMTAGGPWLVIACSAAALAIGIWAAGQYEKEGAHHDAAEIVIDEVAAMWLVLAFTPHNVLFYAAAFFLFRAADIYKPWPAGRIDRELRGGLGVMLDDLMAGVYAALGVLVLRWLFL